MLHRFDDQVANDIDAGTFDRFMASEFDYYTSSDTGRRIIAEQYVGLPYEDPR